MDVGGKKKKKTRIVGEFSCWLIGIDISYLFPEAFFVFICTLRWRDHSERWTRVLSAPDRLIMYLLELGYLLCRCNLHEVT